MATAARTRSKVRGLLSDLPSPVLAHLASPSPCAFVSTFAPMERNNRLSNIAKSRSFSMKAASFVTLNAIHVFSPTRSSLHGNDLRPGRENTKLQNSKNVEIQE